MSLLSLLIIAIVTIPFLVLYAKELFPYFLLAQFYSLPLLVILKTNDIGTFTIGFQVLTLITGVVLFLRNLDKVTLSPSVVCFILLTFLCLYGFFVPQTNSTPIIVKVIASKSILFPIIISVVFFVINDKKYICKIVNLTFFVCIANAIAGVMQLRLGTQKLIALGLPYGTQIREFRSGRVRALGLSLTNFEFALFSGLTAIICYAVITRMILVNDVSRLFAGITLLASVVSLYTSITRQGIFLPLIGIAFLEIVRPRNAIRIYTLIYFFFILIIILLFANNLFLQSDSFFGRIQLWRSLLREYGVFLGNGIGFCGGATTSSFAKNLSQIFVDNFFISIFLQVGVIGLILYAATLCVFFYNTNFLGKSVMISIILTSFITELWDYTSVANLALMIVVTVGNKNFSKSNVLDHRADAILVSET